MRILFFLAMLISSHTAFSLSNAVIINEDLPVVTKDSRSKAELLTVKDYERITGKKLNFVERIFFRMSQKKIIRQLAGPEANKKFDLVGFIVGFLFPPFGLLAALLLSKDKNFKRWAVVGFLAALLVVLIIIIAAFPDFK